MKTTPLLLITIILIILVIFFGPKHDKPIVIDNGIYVGNLDTVIRLGDIPVNHGEIQSIIEYPFYFHSEIIKLTTK